MGMTARLRAGLMGLALLVPASALALDIQVLESPGGAGFWLVEEPSIPIVAMQLSFEGGARLDPAGKEGLAKFFAGMLEEGAGELDAVGFSEARDDLSASFRFEADSDSVTVGARMLVEMVEPAIALLATALTAPRFDPEPLDRVRAQIISNIAEGGQDPEKVAAETWFAAAFPDHPYGRSADGTAESMATIGRDDLVAARVRLLTRVNARIALVGAIGAEQAGRIVDMVLAGLPEGVPMAEARADRPPPPGVTVVDLPVPQSAAVFGQIGLPLTDPDYMAAYVMNYVLGGGGFSSRLMIEVREKRGLAYGVYSNLSNFDEAAVYLGRVQTENPRMAETLAVIRAEWARMAAEGITAEELDAAKRYLTGSFPLRFDSNAKIAGYLVFLQETGLGKDYLERRNALVEAVTLEDVRRVATRLLRPEALSIVVVGQPKGL
jgi:zinc protease